MEKQATKNLSSGGRRSLPGIGTVFADTVSRCRSPFILYLAAMALTGPLALLLNLLEYKHPMQNVWEFPGLSYVGLLIFGGASCVIPMVIFSYLDNRRALDVLHALPVTRSVQFLGNTLAGLFLLYVPVVAGILPVAVLCDLSTRWGEDNGWSSGPLLGSNVRLFLTAMVIGLTLYMLMSFVMFCCSTLLESVCYFAIILLGYWGLVAGLNSVLSAVTFGSTEFPFYSTFVRFSVFGILSDGILSGEHPLSLYLFQLFAVSVLFFLLAFKRAAGRKSEQAGGYVYPPVYFIAAGGGSVVAGMVTYLLFKDLWEKGTALIFAVLIAVFCYVILDTIRNRGLKNIVRSLTACGIGAAAVAVFALIISATGTFGYEDRIPALENIEKVSVACDALHLYDTFSISDAENIKQVRDFHQSLLANKDTVENRKDVPLQDYTPYDFDGGEKAYSCGSTYVTLTYTLKNGRALSRRYTSVPLLLTEPLYELAQSGSYAEALSEKLRGMPEEWEEEVKSLGSFYQERYGDEYAVDFRVSNVLVDGSGPSTRITLGSKLFNAMADDIAARPEGWFLSPEENPVFTVGFYVDAQYNFNIYPSDENTLAVLAENGCYDPVKKESLIQPDFETDSSGETADEYLSVYCLVIPKEREKDFNGVSGLFHFSELGTPYGWYGDADGIRIIAEEEDRQEIAVSPIAGEGGDCSLTYEEVKKLSSLVRLTGFSEEGEDVLFIDGSTYLIPEENKEEVGKILKACRE